MQLGGCSILLQVFVGDKWRLFRIYGSRDEWLTLLGKVGAGEGAAFKCHLEPPWFVASCEELKNLISAVGTYSGAHLFASVTTAAAAEAAAEAARQEAETQRAAEQCRTRMESEAGVPTVSVPSFTPEQLQQHFAEVVARKRRALDAGPWACVRCTCRLDTCVQHFYCAVCEPETTVRYCTACYAVATDEAFESQEVLGVAHISLHPCVRVVALPPLSACFNCGAELCDDLAGFECVVCPPGRIVLCVACHERHIHVHHLKRPRDAIYGFLPFVRPHPTVAASAAGLDADVRCQTYTSAAVTCGTSVVFEITLKNVGVTPWPLDCKLVYAANDKLEVSDTSVCTGVAPGVEQQQFVRIRAPRTPHEYCTTLVLQTPQGVAFGPCITLRVTALAPVVL